MWGETMADLYNKIYSLCQSKGVSGAKMCAEVGISKALLTELKTGRTKSISLKTAQKIADYFEVPITTFTEEEPTEVEQIQDELFEQRKILFDLSAKASKEDLEKFIKMMNAIIDED